MVVKLTVSKMTTRMSLGFNNNIAQFAIIRNPAKTVFIRVNQCLKNEIGPFVPQWLCGRQLIMQNKANFKMGKMTISTATLKAYANKQRTMNNECYSKQTQSNPISNDQSQFQT